MRPTVATVNLSAIMHNVRLFIAHIPQSQMMAVVKADAYGHGLLAVARAARTGGAQWLGVATAAEALALRAGGLEPPIMIIGALMPDEYARLIGTGISLPVGNMQQILAVRDAARRRHIEVRLHMKIETGFHRLGFAADALPAALELICGCPWLAMEGMYTHFADADAPDDAFDDVQYERFAKAEQMVRGYGLKPLVHVCNSAAGMRRPQLAARGLFRVGIALYGCDPEMDMPGLLPGLRPALSWETEVAAVQDVPKGDSIGYGRGYVAQGDMRIATLPVGYADGYPRSMTGRAQVLIGGRRCPVAGRICMDHIMADVTGLACRVGDRAVLLGVQGNECIGGNEMARWQDSNVYEVMTNISRRVPRQYEYEG